MSALVTLDTQSPNFNTNLQSTTSSCSSNSHHSNSVSNKQQIRNKQFDIDTFNRVKDQLNIKENESLIVTGTSKGFPIMYVSDGWVDMCGWTKDQACGQGGGINQGEGTNKGTLVRMGEALKAEQACKCQLINYREDGSPFWNIISIFPIKENGKTILFAGQLQDYSYHLTNFVRIQPQQYFVGGHTKGDYFMKFLKDGSELSKNNSIQQDGRDNVNTYAPDVRPITCLGFSYGDLEPEYVFHRLIDAAIDLKLTITPDETLPCSAYAWKKIDDGEEIISVQLGIKIDWKGQGSFHIERRHGDTFAFHALYRQFRDRLLDIIRPTRFNSNNSSQDDSGSGVNEVKGCSSSY